MVFISKAWTTTTNKHQQDVFLYLTERLSTKNKLLKTTKVKRPNTYVTYGKKILNYLTFTNLLS